MEPPAPPSPYSPYSGSGTQNSQQHQATLSDDLMNDYKHDLKTYSHPHELLISIAVPNKGVHPSTMFHHWNSIHVQSPAPASISSLNTIPVKVGHEELKLLHGLRDLGSFQLAAPNAFSSARIHEYLTALIDPLASSTSDSKVISSIISRLQTTSTSSSQPGFVSVQFLALTVHSNSSDELFSGGPVPVWQWFTPAATSSSKPLMKRSFWKPDLEDLLNYPKWSPQGKHHLRLQGVSEERAEKLRRSMVLFPASQENAILHENSESAS